MGFKEAMQGMVKRKNDVPAAVQKVQRFVSSVAAGANIRLGCDDTRFWGLFKKRKCLIKYLNLGRTR